MAAKNLTTTILPEFGRGMASHKLTPFACWGCPTACKYTVEVTSGPHKRFVGTIAGGGEDTEGAASIMGITESGAIFYLTELNDRLGFDTAASGCAMAAAFEAFERGLITKEDSGPHPSYSPPSFPIFPALSPRLISPPSPCREFRP